jgi:N-hydroxyarylamine O-acetyltransferase
VGADSIKSRPRTHMALLVEAPGDPQPYLADVGFGAIGALLEPVPLTAGVDFRDAERRHRLVHAPHDGPLALWALEAYDGKAGASGEGAWMRQYAFTLEPFEKPDFDVINWHIGTNPRSPFTQRPYVQRVSAESHLLLNGRLLSETRPDGTVTEREVTQEAETRRLLDEEFGITVPEGMTVLR